MSRIASHIIGSPNTTNPDSILDGDLRCFFRPGMIDFVNSPTEQIGVPFHEAFGYAWRAKEIIIQGSLRKKDFDPVDFTTIIPLNPGVFDEQGMICESEGPGLRMSYDHRVGFGTQLFWINYSAAWFGGVLGTLRYGDDLVPSGVTFDIMGRVRPLLELSLENQPDDAQLSTGTLSYQVYSWWRYDGIYSGLTGEQIITPVPTGL